MTRKIIRPTPEEAAEITRDALTDPDNPPWPAEMIRTGRRGRPPLGPEAKKQQVTMLLDPDVLDRLKADGPGWQTRANAMLRGALGI